MKRYEFNIVHFQTADRGAYPNDPERATVQTIKILDEYGKHGWKVVACNNSDIILQREVTG